MARTITITEDERQESAESNSFAPLPAGWYNVSIYDVKEKAYTSDRSQGKEHYGKPYYDLELRVSEGDYADRRLFGVQIPLFKKWGPSQKQGPNFGKRFGTNLIPFFEALADEFGEPTGEFVIPDPEDLLGKRLRVRLRIEDNEYQGEVTRRNAVNGFKPYIEGEDPSPKRPGSTEDSDSAGDGFDL